MKKTILLLCLLLCLSLAACGGGEDQPEGPPGEEQPVEESAAPPDEEQQLTLIAGQGAQWAVEEELDWWAYAVTDLDQDGLLELMSTETHGTGHFTTTRLWEVSETGDRLVRCTEDSECPPALVPRSDGADGTQPVRAYLDEAAGAYFYILESETREQVDSYWAVKQAVSLAGTDLRGEYLGYRHTGYVADEAENSTVVEKVEYQDANGQTISAGTFETLGQQRFAGCTPMLADFDWLECLSLEEQGQEELYAQLSASWNGFRLEME